MHLQVTQEYSDLTGATAITVTSTQLGPSFYCFVAIIKKYSFRGTEDIPFSDLLFKSKLRTFSLEIVQQRTNISYHWLD